jgi:hypothetical protein
MKKNIFIIIVFFVIVFFVVGYKSIGYNYNSSFSDRISNLLPENFRKVLLNSVFIVPNLKNKLEVSKNENQEKKDEIFVKDYHFFYEYIMNKDINFNFFESRSLNFKNQNFKLTKFKSEQNFLPKYHNRYSKSSLYIDVLTSENVLFIVSGSGVIMKSNLDNFINSKNININSKLIDSNLNEIIKYKQFYENSKFGIKDIMIDSNYLYVSFTNSPFKDCYNISVYKAKILKNTEKLIFKKVFDPEECVQIENDYGEFEAYHSGGRMSKYDNDSFFLSIGEFRYRDLAQDTKSIFGKILKFNETKNEFEVIAMGTRNVQGLVYDPKLDFIVFTEHGPLGGDEININKSIGNEIENYGWPIASYGEHYPPDLEKKYSKAPLKNHIKIMDF